MAYRFELAGDRQPLNAPAPDGLFAPAQTEQLQTIAAPGSAPALVVTPNIIPIGGDDIPDDNTTTYSLNVNEGQVVTSSINHPQDTDWFVVTLSANQGYTFEMTPTDTSGTGPDFKIVVHDADGNVLSEQDSHGMGAGEVMNFTPTTGGTYYVSIEPFTPADIGEYTLSAHLNADPGGTAGTPLAAIDWGTMVSTSDIKVYYGKPGEVFGSADDPVVSVGWDDFAKDATFVAFQQYENIVNVHFTEVDSSADADFVLVQTVTAPALLGQMRPPGEENEGLGDFNKAGFDYDEPSTHQGGFSFITFIHEFGHGMGLAHPHDNGGSSEVMHGVSGDIATGFTTGDFSLNQGIYTTMSYNDGWQEDPDGSPPETSFGYQGTLMALDVAVLQQKYGANMSFHTGDDTYVLPSTNEPGTFWSCIWDAGGSDTMRAGGGGNSTIDLREATLQYEAGGGGFISWQSGIFGGFTIANGVVIENAQGLSGDDTITGNGAANALSGGGGNDSMFGGTGQDVIGGDKGSDTIMGDAGADDLSGGTGNDTLRGGGGADILRGGIGADTLTGGNGNDTFVYADGDGDNGADFITDLATGDVIDLSAIDADIGTAGDQAFTLVHRFDGHAGEYYVKFVTASGMTKVFLDTDGDSNADFVIAMDGNHVTFDGFVE
jgi:Ca2+-binding RTX toxin-like protein